MQGTLYHSLLRVSALTLSLVLLFVSGIVSPVTKELSYQTGEYLVSAVGMAASVEPNELNVITAKLTEQEQELKAREAALVEREIAVSLNTGNDSSDKTVFLLSVILFILLVLIILNYVLDFLRGRSRLNQPIPVT